MARTTGKSGFKMRSGNASTFKMMGSSPMRVDPKEVITKGEEKIVGTTTTETDKSTDTKTDYRRTDKGYTPPSEFMSDEEWNALGSEGRRKSNEKYEKANTRDIVRERSETKSKPKELTPQEKMAKGKHHSKYWDPKTKSYRVKQYDYKQLSSGKYTSSGRGKQTGDISLAEWKEQNPSLASEGTKSTKF